ncbi:hypothetical protein [Pseudomonas sp. JG-B]|uniref:hypothetical protein n=1 Tax=Pseudomonas sp. JG-B TaxID=2603214 RepID=UPI00129E2139|nr:hypothetical protein [Pseudomonas sp. JG-B]MRK19089.1 hypothetical protein [Pseudomonas sp. JG-B]
MNVKRLAVTMAIASALGGCVIYPHATTRVSPTYTATGSFPGVRADVYGQRTLLEFADEPSFLKVIDSFGNAVPYEKEGNYYRLARRLDHFSIQAGVHTVHFNVIEPEGQQGAARDVQQFQGQSIQYAPVVPPAASSFNRPPASPIAMSAPSPSYGPSAPSPWSATPSPSPYVAAAPAAPYNATVAAPVATPAPTTKSAPVATAPAPAAAPIAAAATPKPQVTAMQNNQVTPAAPKVAPKVERPSTLPSTPVSAPTKVIKPVEVAKAKPAPTPAKVSTPKPEPKVIPKEVWTATKGSNFA